nr:penicillin-binding protein [Caulobacteraceae bacterium]
TGVWVGRDDNTPMAKVTGGGAPAEIWHNFMAAALPRLQAQAIPGGEAVAAAPKDAIGDILSGDAPPPADAEEPDAPPPVRIQRDGDGETDTAPY